MNNKDMSLTAEIYQALLHGLKTEQDYTHLRAKYDASKGPFYNALGQLYRDMWPKMQEFNEVQAKLDAAGLKLDEAGLTLDELDRRIKEAESSLAPLEETKNALSEGIETLEAKLTEKSNLLEHARELGKLGFDIERLRQLREALTEIGAKSGLKGQEAVSKFFDDLKDYDAKTGFEGEIQRLETITETKKLEAENWQAKAERLESQYTNLKEAIDGTQALLKRGVEAEQIVSWNGIVSKLGGPEELQDKLGQYKSMSGLLNARKEEAEAYGLRLTKVQSQLETLEKKRAKIEAAIDALKVAGIKELKAMTEATERQLKAMVATQITETQVVGQGVRKELDALGEKAIEVGRTVGIVEEQLRRDGKARDILNLLQNPMAATYEDYAALVLLLAKSMRIWVNENKDKFTLPYRVDEGLEALVKNLGGS